MQLWRALMVMYHVQYSTTSTQHTRAHLFLCRFRGLVQSESPCGDSGILSLLILFSSTWTPLLIHQPSSRSMYGGERDSTVMEGILRVGGLCRTSRWPEKRHIASVKPVLASPRITVFRRQFLGRLHHPPSRQNVSRDRETCWSPVR